MDKQSKFKLLQEIALTVEESEEYFELQEQKESSDHIFLPMSIGSSHLTKDRFLAYHVYTQKLPQAVLN